MRHRSRSTGSVAARRPAAGRMLAHAVLALCALLAAAAAGAQEFATPPSPAAPRPLNIGAPVEQRLPNGLRVVLARRPGVQLVTAELVVLSGSEADPAGRAGLASMTAGLLTRGTRRHSAPALARAAESLGGALGSGAGWHRTDVSITVSVPRLDAALGLLAETALEPVFAPAEIERLRDQSLDALKVAYSEPGTLAAQAAQHLLFGAGAYGHPADGTPASLRRMRREDLTALHARVFRPDNAVLVLAGDLDAPAALALARRHFGRWKAPPGEAPAALQPGTGLAPTAAVIDLPQSGQAAVVLALALPPLGEDRAAAAVLNAVLGGAYSSRLNQEIRIKRGLSYGAFSLIDSRPGAAQLRLVVQTKNESAAEVTALMQAAVDTLARDRIDDAELAARKATLIGNFSRSVETTAGLAAGIAALVVAGFPPDDLRNRVQRLSAVDADAVQRFAARLPGAPRRLAVAGEAALFAPALAEVAPGFITVPAGRLDLERSDGLAAP